MADTQRTKTDLLTNLFQDGQPANSILAQAVRDLIESVAPSHGGMYISSSVATVIGAAGTFVKALGTTTLTGGPSRFDMPANNRLRYTGVAARHLQVNATVSMTAGSNNQEIGFKIFHWDDSAASGSLIDPSEVRRKVGTGTDIGSLSVLAGLTVEQNDYVELWVTNFTSTATVTVDFANLFAFGLFE